jgi:hypothetical protein
MGHEWDTNLPASGGTGRKRLRERRTAAYVFAGGFRQLPAPPAGFEPATIGLEDRGSRLKGRRSGGGRLRTVRGGRSGRSFVPEDQQRDGRSRGRPPFRVHQVRLRRTEEVTAVHRGL